MKTKKVLTAFLALLLMSNMSFAQKKQNVNRLAKQANPYADPVKKAVAKANQTNKRYNDILNHIKNGKISNPGGDTIGGVVLIGTGIYMTRVIAPLAGSVGAAASGVGAIAIGAIAIYQEGKKLYKKHIYRSGEDANSMYPKIMDALTNGKGKVFSEYTVVLTNANNTNELHLAGPVLERLAKFLGDPYTNRPIVESKPEKDVDYRFLFDFPQGHPEYANSQVYADVNVGFRTILVRSDGIREPGKRRIKNVIKAKKK